MFEAIYGSPYHHPYFFWAAGFPVLALLGWLWATKRPSARDVAAAPRIEPLLFTFQLAILTDAWLTAPHDSPLTGSVAQNVAIAFVVLGDARYFLLLERVGKGRGLIAAALVSLGWSLVIPIASLVGKLVSSQGRVLFLTYELMFAALAFAVARLVVARMPEGPGKTFARWLTAFEVVQYATWASADVLILSGIDVGYLLRLVPNTLYYVVFVPFAWFAHRRAFAPTADLATEPGH